MKRTNKRAFIMENCNSPYIAQAIFILKDGFEAENTKVITEAERIVAAYMGRKPHVAEKGKKYHTKLIVALCTFGLLCALTYAFRLIV